MKLFPLLVVAPLFLAQAALPGHVLAEPPPPPPPPICKSCPGPPPPPTPLPTAGPDVSAPQQVVDVHLAPTHISRGHKARLQVTAQESASVTVRVQYKGDKKAAVSHSRIGSSGVLVKTLKIPKTAPLGVAQVTVGIEGEDEPFTAALTVTK